MTNKTAAFSTCSNCNRDDVFAGVLIETAMNVTFPTLIRQFDLTTAQVQWVTTIYL